MQISGIFDCVTLLNNRIHPSIKPNDSRPPVFSFNRLKFSDRLICTFQKFPPQTVGLGGSAVTERRHKHPQRCTKWDFILLSDVTGGRLPPHTQTPGRGWAEALWEDRKRPNRWVLGAEILGRGRTEAVGEWKDGAF